MPESRDPRDYRHDPRDVCFSFDEIVARADVAYENGCKDGGSEAFHEGYDAGRRDAYRKSNRAVGEAWTSCVRYMHRFIAEGLICSQRCEDRKKMPYEFKDVPDKVGEEAVKGYRAQHEIPDDQPIPTPHTTQVTLDGELVATITWTEEWGRKFREEAEGWMS